MRQILRNRPRSHALADASFDLSDVRYHRPSSGPRAAGDDAPLLRDDALAALRALGEMHSVFRTGDGRGVVMANPFSALPTPFRVTANGVDHWANCAWNILGVPAALSGDATIHATCTADD